MVERLVNTEVNARRLVAVEQNFGSSGQSLSDPGRVLVGEGILTKLCRKKPKSRQFFLCNDILIYGTIVGKKKYNNQHIMSLKDVRIEEIPDTPQPAVMTSAESNGDVLRNGWLIISPSKSFAVYAQTAMEKQEWMSHMTRCIDGQKAKSGITSDVGETAPAWVPDVEAHSCMRCEKTKFSALQRRHHCRKCGYVVCSSCSSNKAMLPQQSSKPLRVCDICFQSISSDGNSDVHVVNKKGSLVNRLSSKQKNNSLSVPRAVVDSSDSDSSN